ncbi:SDR family NAD(P)-dependent oxidoreductase [Microbacteriaceae bacterium K1510]|nr:SDR family NAD(P)-dependent oxidoreductase [Microbacteriaceae bacterium K1510]
MDFSNKHVVVTGGTGALGAAVVAGLLRGGAHCIVPYRAELEAQRFAHRGDPNVTMIAVGDLADETQVARVYAGLSTASPLWASIHIAGGFAAGTVADTDKAALMTQLNGNLVSCFLCCRAAIGAMHAARQGGRIVNVASRQALEWRSGAGMAAYTIAKSGVATLTTTLADEVVHEGILVNAVAPSIMDTGANRAAMPKADFNAWPKVDEVAATILFLASPDNKVTRGAVVPVYGKA